VSLLIVSGTGTGIGKTITTAAVAALARARGQRVAVVKPVQTGEPPGAAGDLAVVAALTGLADRHELARYHIATLAEDRDLVLVEGAGGLLVRYDPAGTTLADLAAMLDAPVLVVTAAGLGTLNHTALTLEALATRKLACAGVVVGRWPADPGLAERCNLDDLVTVAGGPLAGLLPEGLGALAPDRFLAAARRGLSPAFGGTFSS
jgi:dethiobiotin synthetase